MQKFIIAVLVIGSLAIGGYVVSLGMDNSTSNANSVVESGHSGLFTSVEELVHDWGDINISGGDVSKTFTLTNSEDEPLMLRGAMTSCMCTTAEFTLSDGSKSGAFGMHGGPEWTHLVQPGESFDVEVVFDPMAHGPEATGPITRTVNIISKPDLKAKGVQYTRIDVSGDVLSEADYQSQYES